MGRRIVWLIALISVLAACSEDQDAPGETSSTSSTTTTTSTLPEEVPSDPGRLAVVDSAGNIIVMEPDGSNLQAVTDRGDDPVLYMQPIWAPDGQRLAWGQRTGTGFGIGIARVGTDETKTLTTPNLPYYTYWSPDGRHLAALHNGDSGVQFQIIDVDDETAELLDEDTPFYFSWSPAGDRVVTHAGVSRTQVITPDGEREDLEPTSGTYLSPQWTPNGVFHVVGNLLMLEDAQGQRTPLADVSGLTMFVSNAQGTHVALQTTGGSDLTASTEDFPAIASNSVVVVEVETGDTEIVDDALALGFFWSPNGRSLLVLTLSGSEVVPTVWTSDGEEQVFSPYVPSRSMLRDAFPFFPQYAQSVSFWAPDSSAFAFAGTLEGESGVWVQALAEEAPRRVSDGTWVAWSPPSP
ncbi:MAG TPA: hypothetical protein VMM14_07635 [Acidimicrobiia bacterium]|nr:hypothetical protein [Acidimicrobiia bacterium]